MQRVFLTIAFVGVAVLGFALLVAVNRMLGG
jgi:hypothetical protein